MKYWSASDDSDLKEKAVRWAALLLTTAVCVLVLVSGAAAAPSPRIINGANAGASFGTRWPFAASLGTTGANSYSGHFCGGSLIIPRVVVTAAHCVESSTADGVTVTLGRYDLTTLTGHDYGVDRILLYPNYHQFGLDGDIALLELASAASEPTIQLVGANEGGMWGGGLGTAVSDPDGPWIGGWGDTCADGSGCIPAAFQQAEVPIQPDATCGDDLLGGDSAFDAATMLCAGILDTAGGPTNGVDTCFGDSGGPLIVSDGSGGWRLAGITSFGVTAECAGQKFGFFTRVDAFRDWVNEQLACGMGGGPDACAPTNPTPQAPDPDLSSWSALGHVVVQLRPGYDAGGMDGYAYVWDTNPTTVPNPVSDSYAAADSTSLDSGPVADGSSLYLHIRAYDAANNPADTTVDYGPFWIDSTAPTNPALSSGTATDTWTRTTAISVNLAGAADNLSGIAGYSQVWDTSPVTDPDTSVDTDLESTTSPHFQFAPALYLHVRTVDVAGNVSAASVTLGPFRIDAQKPTAPGRPRLISRTRTSVTFAWPASTDGRGIARYFVLRKMSNGVWKTVKALPGSKRRATITGLKHARSYSFAIRASDPLPTANLSSSSPAAQLKTA